MEHARTEVNGYCLALDQYGRQHMVVEQQEFVSQPRVDRLAHGWRSFITAEGLRLERTEDGLLVTTTPPILKLQPTTDFLSGRPSMGS